MSALFSALIFLRLDDAVARVDDFLSDITYENVLVTPYFYAITDERESNGQTVCNGTTLVSCNSLSLSLSLSL